MAQAAVDRSKRYDHPVHPEKQGGGKKATESKATGEAEHEAKKTAGDPPSAAKSEGAIHKTDPGPEPGHGPAFGEVAERHAREMKDMHSRHSAEVGSTMEGIHARHAKEIKDMGARHGKEIEEHWASQEHHPSGSGDPGKAKSGEGPKLGKTEHESDKGEKMKGADGEGPKLGKTKEEGRGGTEP